MGVGSIGKRHLTNLHDIYSRKKLKLEVHALRSENRPLENSIIKLIDKQIFEIKKLDCNYDMILLSNPTSLHYEYLKELIPYSKNFFIEKPLFDQSDYELKNLNLDKESLYYVACPLRYTSVIKYIKELVSNNHIYSARAICSSYLPDWRKDVDYTKVYSASKENGGGVCIDLIHEWDYITYLFGFPIETKSFNGKVSDLNITSEDLAVYIARYVDKFIEIHLDYFGRVPSRYIQLFTKEITIIGDIIGSKISFSDGRESITFNDPPNDKYIREMEYFLELCERKKENLNDICYALKTLKLAQS